MQPLIAPMFAPPSFSEFISLEDLMQQQTSDSMPVGTPEAPYISSLALPDILAAQSSRAPMEVIEPQPQRVEEILSQPGLKAESWSEQPAISPLQPEPVPPPRAVHIPAPPRKETPASDDVPSPQASLPAQPRAEKNPHKPAFLPGELPAGPVPTTIVPAQPITSPLTLEAVLRDTASREVSGEPPEPLSPFASEGDEASVGADLSRPSPMMNFNKLLEVSHPTHEASVGADLSRPSPHCISHKRGIAETWRNAFQVPIYRPDGNPTTYPAYFLNQVSVVSPEPLSPHSTERGAPKNLHLSSAQIPSSLLPGETLQSADQPQAENRYYAAGAAVDERVQFPLPGEKDELFSPRDSRRPLPAYEHDGNLTPEPGAQQMPLVRPGVDEGRRSEPVIRVSIGRVEVRATAPPAAPVMKRAAPAAPALTLSDYLKRRKGET